MKRLFYRTLVAAILLLRMESACAQDWPQWRGPLGQGTTSAKNLPPATRSSSLKVLWKTPIPGEGCSSPIVSQDRVYLTTAYAQQHPLDGPAFWASVVLAGCVIGLSFMQVPKLWRAFGPLTVGKAALGLWTMAAIGLTAVVLAKPPWFWRFADPWSGTTVEVAKLPWVESLNLRPAIVLVSGSLLLIFAWKAGAPRLKEGGSSSLVCWLAVVTFAVTVVSAGLLGLICLAPDWFFQANQPWLVWLVTGGLAMFALAGSVGWLTGGGRAVAAGVMLAWGVAFTGVLFLLAPHDEFGLPLSLQNRIIYVVPALMLLFFHARALLLPGGSPSPFSRSSALPWLTAGLAVTVFVRSNYIHPQSGVVRAVLCLDASSGEVLWSTPAYIAPAEKRHTLNSLATPTPACDSERVYAYFGSGLAALSMDGRVLWLKRDADFADFIRYGAGSSVALADDRIIIYRDSEFMGHDDHLDDDIRGQTTRRPTALTAYDKATGEVKWSISPPFSHDSYMTPLVWTRAGQVEVVVATWKTVAGFAISDGSERWTHSYPMQQIVPSPAVNGDCLFITGGNLLPCPMAAVRAPSKTELAQTVWSNSKTGGNIVSPVCWNGLLFSISHLSVMTCRDADSGQTHWTERLGDRCLASLTAGDGKVYALEQDGTLHVLAADVNFTELASHSFEESCSATPALANGMVFVRTSHHLCCLGSGE